MSLYATCRCGVPEGQEGAHRTDCPLYGFIPMSGPVCRGSWALGTACRRCERCIATRPLTALTTPPTPDRIGKDAVREALEDAFCAGWDARHDGQNYYESRDNYVTRALSATPAQEGKKACSFCPNPATGWANGESDMMPACDGCQSQHESHPGFLSFAEKAELKADADANRKLPARPRSQEVDETERLRRATMACVDAMRAWIVPDGISADEAMGRIVSALDNPEINPIILEADNARS